MILGLEAYVDRFSLDWIYNRKTIQSLFSNVCGRYCIHFILFCCRNISLHAILFVFSLDLTENDRRVFDFICELYNKQQTHTNNVIYIQNLDVQVSDNIQFLEQYFVL